MIKQGDFSRNCYKNKAKSKNKGPGVQIHNKKIQKALEALIIINKHYKFNQNRHN